MAIIYDVPKYPVIDKAPGIRRTVSNFTLSDWAWVAAFGGVAAPYGFFTGLKQRVAPQSAVAASIIGLTAGYCFSYQNSFGRLMGLKPNDREVELYLKKGAK